MATTSTHPQNVTGANYNNAYTQSYKYPEDVGGNTKEYPHYIRFIARKLNSASGTLTSIGEVDLYMPPDALKTSYSQGVGDVELGGFIKMAGANMEGVGAKMAAGDVGAAGAAFDAIKGNIAGADKFNMIKDMGKALVGGAAKQVAGFAGGTGAQAISRATGQILNPHKAMVYQGPGGFRTFSFTFVLVPKSADEAKEIFNIVKFFKRRMHPGTGTGAGINDISSVTLTYPDEFEIKYYVNNKLVDGSDSTKPLFKIHNCFMESFATDYTTSSLVSFMDDDQPLTTTISMGFKETQLLTKTDIDAGY